MKFSIVHSVDECREVKGIEKYVLLTLALCTDEKKPTSQVVYPGVQTLMDKAGLSDKKTIIKYLHSLENKGFIAYAGMHGHCKQYRFNNDALHFDELEAEWQLKKPASYRKTKKPALTSADLPTELEEEDPLGELPELPTEEAPLELEASPPAPDPAPPASDNVPWGPSAMVAFAQETTGHQYTSEEYKRELEAAQRILSFRPGNTNCQTIDRSTFETAWRFELTSGKLIKPAIGYLRLDDFWSEKTLDIAIRLSQNELANERKKQGQAAAAAIRASQGEHGAAGQGLMPPFESWREETGRTRNHTAMRLAGQELPPLKYIPPGEKSNGHKGRGPLRSRRPASEEK